MQGSSVLPTFSHPLFHRHQYVQWCSEKVRSLLLYFLTPRSCTQYAPTNCFSAGCFIPSHQTPAGGSFQVCVASRCSFLFSKNKKVGVKGERIGVCRPLLHLTLLSRQRNFQVMNLGCAERRVYMDHVFWVSNVFVTSGDGTEAPSLFSCSGVRAAGVLFG